MASASHPDSLFPKARGLRTLLGYLAMLLAALAALWLIRWLGRDLGAPQLLHKAAPPPKTEAREGLGPVLLAIATIVSSARAVSFVAGRFLKQPPVMGEIAAGLMLGPSLFGAFAPSAAAFLLPSAALPHLQVVANVGVVLFMFLVGLELDTRILRGTAQKTVAISHASIVAPFLMGSGMALWLYPRYADRSVSFPVFALFIGISLSVTAFPVLARILGDRGLTHTPLGGTALACAAANDVTAWCLLALVSGIASTELRGTWITLAMTGGYLLVMLLCVRPLVRWLTAREDQRDGALSTGTLAGVVALMLLSAAATDAIGVHALFGAFLLGVFIPHEARLAEQLRLRIEDLARVLLLPVFFAVTGLRTELGRLADVSDWLVCGTIVVVATLGKFGGTAAAARVAGLDWPNARALGVLMNTRGLMELIVLDVGRELGVLSPTLFAMLVLMTLVTTFATAPLLAWAAPTHPRGV